MGLFSFFRRRKEEKKLEEVVSKYEPESFFTGNKRDEAAIKRYLLQQCETLANVSTDYMNAKDEYEVITSYLNDIQTIENMDEADRMKLSDVAGNIMNLEENTKYLQDKVKRLPDSQYAMLDSNKDEMPKAISRLKENENSRDIMKKDMDYLEGEKLEWSYEKSLIKDEQKKLKTACIVILVVEAMLMIGFLAFFMVEETMIYNIIIIVMLVIALLLLLVLIRIMNNSRDIKQCLVNYNKAVSVQNTIKIRFINVANACDYAYEKYHCRNARELSRDWELYLETVKEREKLANANDDLSYYKKSLISLLRTYRLYDAQIWPNQAAALVDKKEMVEVKHALLERRTKIRNRMEKAYQDMRDTKDIVTRTSGEHHIFTPEMQGILDSVEKILK